MQLQQTEETPIQPTPTPGAVLPHALAADAQSQDSAVRQSALRALQQQGVEGIEPLLELFRSEMRGQIRRKKFRRSMAKLTLGSAAILYPILMFGGGFASGGGWYLWITLVAVLLLLTLVGASLFGLTFRLALNTRQQEIARALAEIDDVRAIGPLIEAMSYEGAQTPIVRDTLIRLLYRVTPSNAGLISQERRLALYGMLNASVMHDHAKAALCGAILTAMEQMGDKEALPFVQRLAQSSAWTPAQHAVCNRARQCLMYWTTNMEQARGGTTLLRASEGPSDNPAALLRAAQADDINDPRHLLRPDHAANESQTDAQNPHAL